MARPAAPNHSDKGSGLDAQLVQGRNNDKGQQGHIAYIADKGNQGFIDLSFYHQALDDPRNAFCYPSPNDENSNRTDDSEAIKRQKGVYFLQ
jgi:hypothetical protein